MCQLQPVSRGAEAQPAMAAQSGVEGCERCSARIIRDPQQPRLCAGCAPPSDAAGAIYKVLAAHYARRRASSVGAAPRKAVAP